MKWLRRIAYALLAIVLIVGVGGYLALRTSLPEIDGRIELAGLTKPVDVVRDRDGVPHIRAATVPDAYFALGFVHAQDRLFQMDFLRRLGAGRLSEVVGARTLEVDRTMRTLGLYRLAEASLAHISADTRAALEAYAAGVNAYLDTRSGVMPPAFVGLWYTPDRWRPADSLVWGRLMGLRLSGNWRAEALRAQLSEKLSPEQIEDLWPRYDGTAPPTVSTASVDAPVSLFAGLLRDFPDPLRRVTASNSWAMGGAHTATGKPILANDPHLGFTAPNLWYLARIEAPGLAVTGATVPGVPFTILGHNGRIAWTLTTNESDTQDLFIERVAEGAPDKYDTPDGPRPFVTREEIIGVRGGDAVRHTVRSTRHGPVLSDIVNGLGAMAGDGKVVALAAASFRADDRTAEALHRLNRATDWASFLDAMRLFHSPHQNVTFADVEGNIGFVAPARVPIRKKGAGLIPVPGWSGEYDWTGFIPFEQLPRTFNPSAGRIVNANHRVAPDDYPYYLGRVRTAPYRAERIHQQLTATNPHRLSDSAALHVDSLSLMVRDIKPLLMKIKPADGLSARALDLVGPWNGDMARDRPEPLIFIAWLRALNWLLYVDELGTAFDAYWGLRPAFVRHALTRRRIWCDDIRTQVKETCDTIIASALSRAMRDLAEAHGDDPSAWRWGALHQTRFRHQIFGSVPVLQKLFDVRIENDGGSYTVNRQAMGIASRSAPFRSVHGAGYRAIYDLSNLDNSLFMQGTGQSGNVLSPLYANLTERWRDGRYLKIPSAREAALDGAVGVLTLTPARRAVGR